MGVSPGLEGERQKLLFSGRDARPTLVLTKKSLGGRTRVDALFLWDDGSPYDVIPKCQLRGRTISECYQHSTCVLQFSLDQSTAS